MAAVLFADAYVVALTAKWSEGSVDSKVYTDLADAETARDAHNAKLKLEGKYAAQVLDLHRFITMLEDARIREQMADL